MGDSTTANFVIALRDETSKSAKSAADALEDLKAKIERDTKALRQMQAAMSRLKGGGKATADAQKELRDKIAAQKTAIAQAQAKFLDLGGSMESVSVASASTWSGLLKMLGPLPAIAAGFLAIVTAVVGATAALLQYGIAQSDARRSELLHLEGLTTIRRAYQQAAGSGAELQAAIDRVSDSSALGRGEISRYTEQLYRMGLRGQDLTDALEGMSIVGSVQGDRMAQRFAGMSAAAIRTGGSVRRLADDVRARLGGIASRQALSLGRQFERLHDNVGRIFSDLNIEPFLRALHEVTSLFSQSTATGRALKAIVETIFDPLLSGVEGAGPILRRFFQGLVLGALDLAIAIGEARLWFRRTFGGSDILRGIDSMTIALTAGKVVFWALVVVLGVALVAFLAVAAFMATFVAIGLAVVAVVGLIVTAIAGVVEYLLSVDWADIGRTLLDGLVAGIRDNIGVVTSVVRGLADRVQGAFREALGIHSPSRVFAQLGLQIPAGIAAGVDAGAPNAEQAVAGVVGVPTSLGGASSSTSVGPIEIHVHTQATDARGLVDDLEPRLAALFERLALGMGAPA